LFQRLSIGRPNAARLGRVCKINNRAVGPLDVETITVVAPDSPAAQYCIGEYFRELATRFEGGFDPAKSIMAKPDEFAPPDGIFVVVRLGETFVGCGGFKRLNAKSAYLKRMWIAPFARGRGLGRMLLGELEDKAREAGYFTACLETNRALTDAIRMYVKNGYREIAPFNDEYYAHHWFEKGLRS
jgi:GNAT superfamily N-acetyltransferase